MYVPLFKRLTARLPAFNKEVVEGYAYSKLSQKAAMAHLDNIIRCAEETFPEGLVFVESRPCTPIEEYRQSLNFRVDGRSVFDIARSDVYLVRYDFTYNGEPLIPQYLYLPYIRKGGLINLTGKLFSISPVMADKVFSILEEGVFILFSRARVTLRQERHHMVRDNVKVGSYVSWGFIHNKASQSVTGMKGHNVKHRRVYSTCAHYLFCCHGFYETFERYLGFRPVVMKEADYDPEQWPADKWVCYTSTKRRPAAMLINTYAYREIATDLVCLIPREHLNPTSEAFVAGFYYVVDHFPDMITMEDIESLWQWRVVMGYIIFGDWNPQGKVGEDVETHLTSMYSYVDIQMRMELDAILPDQPATIDRLNDVKDFYDLLAYMIDQMPIMLLEGAVRPGKLYGKRLTVARYVLSNINNDMFELLFKLNSCRTERKTADEFNKILSQHFKPKAIFGLTGSKKNNQRHGEVSSVSNPSDNMFFKVSSAMIQQSESNSTSSSNINVDDPENHLDSSYADVGGYGVLPKSSPVGKAKISPWVVLEPDGTVKQRKEFAELTDSVQRDISKR